MDNLQRIVSRQFNDLTQKRQSSQLRSNSYSSFEESVSDSFVTAFPNDTQPIKKFTNKLKKTFRRSEQPSNNTLRGQIDDESVVKNKTVIDKIRNVKDSVSSSQIQNDLMKLYKQAKIIDVRSGKMSKRASMGDNQKLLLFEELDNSHGH